MTNNFNYIHEVTVMPHIWQGDVMLGNNGNLFFKCMQQVTKGFLYHLCPDEEKGCSARDLMIIEPCRA